VPLSAAKMLTFRYGGTTLRGWFSAVCYRSGVPGSRRSAVRDDTESGQGLGPVRVSRAALRAPARAAGRPGHRRQARSRADRRVARPGRPVPRYAAGGGRDGEPRGGECGWPAGPARRLPSGRDRVLRPPLPRPGRPAGHRRAAVRAALQCSLGRRLRRHRGAWQRRRARAGGPAAVAAPAGQAEPARAALRAGSARSGRAAPAAGPAGRGPGRPGRTRVPRLRRRPGSVAAVPPGGDRGVGRGRDRRAGCPDFCRTSGILGYGPHGA
jgi:hypothetical protein